GTRGDQIGRRRLYAALVLVMAAAGTVFALTRWLPALILAALTGTISVEANESGPITSLEQAMIPQVAGAARERTWAFARYNAVAYLAGSLGALAAGGPDFFRRFFPAVPASQRFMLAFPVIGVACALLAVRLSQAVEAGDVLTAERRFPLLRSKRKVAGLAGLFAIDSFGRGSPSARWMSRPGRPTSWRWLILTNERLPPPTRIRPDIWCGLRGPRWAATSCRPCRCRRPSSLPAL